MISFKPVHFSSTTTHVYEFKQYKLRQLNMSSKIFQYS
jgi:hypothetical protein